MNNFSPQLVSFLDTFFYLFRQGDCLILIHYGLKPRLWFNKNRMTKITEPEFARICEGITKDREMICKHNPIGTQEEILLWMLLGCLVSYLNLSDIETPCFNGKPDAETYKDAILFVLKNRKIENFDAEKYLHALY